MSYMHLFENELIKIEVELNDKSKIISTYNLKYVLTEMLTFLYESYPNWLQVKAWWNNSGSPIGLLYNDEKTESLKNKTIGKKDWIYFANEDHQLIAKVYFKKSNQIIELKTSKSELVNNFISKLYSSFGNEWLFFDTFFTDTGNKAYSKFENTYHRRKNHRISPMTLAGKILSNKIEEAKKKKSTVFYVLYFENKPFFKIGHTTNMKFRLYNYMFPSSTSEIYLYEDSVIDFSKSFIIKTKKAKSVEKFLKKKFKKKVYLNDIKCEEVFNNSCFQKLLKSIESEGKITLKQIVDLENSKQLKSILSLLDVPEKASEFFTKGKSNIPLNFNF